MEYTCLFQDHPPIHDATAMSHWEAIIRASALAGGRVPVAVYGWEENTPASFRLRWWTRNGKEGVVEGREVGEGWIVTFFAFGRKFHRLQGQVEPGRERALQVAVEGLRTMLLEAEEVINE